MIPTPSAAPKGTSSLPLVPRLAHLEWVHRIDRKPPDNGVRTGPLVSQGLSFRDTCRTCGTHYKWLDYKFESAAPVRQNFHLPECLAPFGDRHSSSLPD